MEKEFFIKKYSDFIEDNLDSKVFHFNIDEPLLEDEEYELIAKKCMTYLKGCFMKDLVIGDVETSYITTGKRMHYDTWKKKENVIRYFQFLLESQGNAANIEMTVIAEEFYTECGSAWVSFSNVDFYSKEELEEILNN